MISYTLQIIQEFDPFEEPKPFSTTSLSSASIFNKSGIFDKAFWWVFR